MSEVRTEYRIVCHGAGLPGHHEHVFNFPTLEAAEKMREQRSREWAQIKDVASCSEFHVEVREISDWRPYVEATHGEA